MATYSWVKDGGGNWSDPGSWHYPDDDDHSIPGASDEAIIDVEGTIVTNGQSIDLLTLNSKNTILTGGLTAEEVDGPGTLNGGDYNIKIGGGITFAGGTLTGGTLYAGSEISGGTADLNGLRAVKVSGGSVTADDVSRSTLSGGTVHTTKLTDSEVSGADVTADHLDGNIGVSGGNLRTVALVLEDDATLVTRGGTVTADTLKMTDGDSGLLELAVFAGKVTISGAASFTGSRGLMQVGHDDSSSSDNLTGGTLNLKNGFELIALDGGSGNALQTLAGATTAIDGAVLVDMSNGLSGNTGLLANGGTMDLTGTVTLGKTAEGNIQVLDGGTAHVDTVVAGVQAGSSGFIIVGGKFSQLSATGAVTLGVEGYGFLRLNDGAATLRTLVLGADTGGTGGVSVQDGTVEVTNTIVVGGKGNGSVSAILGGHFLAGDVVVAGSGSPTGGPRDVATGFHTQVSGHLTVSNGSEMRIDALTLGYAGYAQASVADGTLSVDHATILARRKGSEAQVSIAGGGDWQAHGDMTVGAAGKARITIDGGTLHAGKDLTLGASRGSSGEIDLAPGNKTEHANLILGGDLTVGAGGAGFFDLDHSSVTMKHSAIMVGETAGSKGTLKLHSISVLTGDSLAIGGTEHSAGGKGNLSITSGSKATFDDVTIWKSGSATLTGGTLHITDDLDGNGTITLGKAGTLILDGGDRNVGVSFAASSKGAELDLADPSQFHAAIKGFAKGDRIAMDGLDEHARLSVAIKGANTIVTIHDHGTADSLTLAGHYGKSAFHLSASGVLTTTAAARSIAKADVLEGGESGGLLYGGAGADTFVFAADDSGKTHTTADTIYDFARADSIDLSGWDANSRKSGTQGFDFIGAHAFSGHVGELHFIKERSDTWIEGDTNGDKKADFVIHLNDAVALRADNFDLVV